MGSCTSPYSTSRPRRISSRTCSGVSWSRFGCVYVWSAISFPACSMRCASSRPLLRVASDEKERRVNVQALQFVQKQGREDRIRPVIKRERDEFGAPGAVAVLDVFVDKPLEVAGQRRRDRLLRVHVRRNNGRLHLRSCT